MLKYIDKFLNSITMYRLVLYTLISWLIIAGILGAFGKLPFTPQALLYSVLVLIVVSWITDNLFVRVFNSQPNSESTWITALILALIISPPESGQYLSLIPFLIWAGIWGVSSKYILAISKKHIFNPVAFSVALTALIIHQSASWWIGTIWILPFILIGGLLIVHKIRRFDLVISFIFTSIISGLVLSYFSTGIHTQSLLMFFKHVFINSPIIFFASVMLTEPLTTPPNRIRRIIYGVITGLVFSPSVHIGWLYSTPELALCFGNIFSWLMSPKSKYILTLESKNKIARDTGEFIFIPDRPISFKPGQYLEWTLGHKGIDGRGNRRYFTISSSPTEKNIGIGIKFDANRSSSFKKALAELDEGKSIIAGQLAGDFIMPKDKKVKLCFIAGGIGVTPFRSMISYLVDKNEQRDITLIYSCKRFDDLAYTNLFHHAHTHLGIKTVSTLTDLDHLPEDWTGYKGFLGVELILSEVPDYMERLFYISGPNALVEATEKILFEIGVSKKQIKTDYFPGF
jgi:ferredoxin-NADP reductase/Na+-transporting NADH:ubiquinone oxidoreductase subunit NqrB